MLVVVDEAKDVVEVDDVGADIVEEEVTAVSPRALITKVYVGLVLRPLFYKQASP